MKEELFQAALTAFQGGQMPVAKAKLEELLNTYPDVPAGHNLSGAIALQERRLDEAEAYFKRAIELYPGAFDFHLNLGNVYWLQQRFVEGIPHFEQSLKLNPNQVPIRQQVLNYYLSQQQHTKAYPHVLVALEQNPLDPQLNMMALQFGTESGDFSQVLKILQTLDESTSDKTQTLPNWKRFSEDAFQAGQYDLAREGYEKIISIEPNLSGAYQRLSEVYSRTQDHQKALDSIKKALGLEPENIHFKGSLANLLREKGQFEEAILLWKDIASVEPDNAIIYHNLAFNYHGLKQTVKAIEHYQKALSLDPNMYPTLCNLAGLYQEMADSKKALELCDKAIQLKPDFQTAIMNKLFCMTYDVDSDIQTIFENYRSWGQSLEQKHRTSLSDKNREHHRIRIGYISPDFRDHAAQYLIKGLLTETNREVVELFCYANVIIPDSVTHYYQSIAEHWRFISHLSDQQIYDLICQDEIDILVDPGAGHTGKNSLNVFAMKPAPIQMTIYPMTTGLSTIDYRFADPLLVSPVSAKCNTEKLLYLKGCFFCFAPPEEDLPLAEIPFLKNGYITFGSFNNIAKLNDQVIELWSDILKAVPESRLILKYQLFEDETVKQIFKDKFEQYGIDSTRIKMIDWIETTQHRLLYNQVDIALDPFPFNGHTTTCEALWMGVPVVTLKSEEHMNDFGRAGYSILSRLDLKELIAQSKQEYVDIALKLAKDVDKRKRLKQQLRDCLNTSPLGEITAFVEDVEAHYQQVWEDYMTRV